MSLHSPADSMIGVRIPKLKVRNRTLEDVNGQNVPSHSAQPSSASYYTNFSDPSTSASSPIHSPQPSSSQTSPVAPVYSVRRPDIAVRSRAPEDLSSPEVFRFPAPIALVTETLNNDQSGEDSEIQPITDYKDTSPSRPQLYDTTSSPSGLPALTERNLASRGSDGGYAWPQKSTKKKGKVNSVFGFFAVKEPSASALEQFANSQRRQVELRGGRGNTSGNTNRKLPAEVPKVNSKWDGLPDWAREAAKEAKKDEKGKSDTLLNKMADHRRPSSQHNSVSTFGSEGSARGKAPTTPSAANQRSSKTGQRPTSTRTHSASSSVKRLRNPSRGRGVPSKSSNPFQQAGQSGLETRPSPMPNPDTTGLADVAYFVPSPATPSSSPRCEVGGPSAPNLSAVLSFYTPTVPTSPHSPLHAHKRTMSDPRLNFGMDNVAAITAFLGDEDVSVPRILPRHPTDPQEDTTAAAAPLPEEPPPPPIPRKSSRRKSSQSNIDLVKFRGGLRRVPTSETIESFVTAEQPPSLSDFPNPPSAPSTSDADLPLTDNHNTSNATPTGDKQAQAIYPPDSPTLSAAILSCQQTKPTSPLTSSPTHRLVKHKSSLGRVSPFPNASSSTLRASPSPTPTELSQQWYKSPQERLGLTSPSLVNRGEAAPWEVADASVGRPTAGTAPGGKRTRWSSFGKKGVS